MGSLAAPRRGGKGLWGLGDGAEPPAQPGGGAAELGLGTSACASHVGSPSETGTFQPLGRSPR